MGTRTIRMEPEDEKLLDRIRRQTGWTTSDALSRGLRALERELAENIASSAYAIYEGLDLGPGGYAAGRRLRRGKRLGGSSWPTMSDESRGQFTFSASIRQVIKTSAGGKK
jgi:hypothetical protein